MDKLNEIFNLCVEKYDNRNDKMFNDFRDELIEHFNNLTKIRDDLKSYLMANSDKFEYNPVEKTISFRPEHRFVNTKPGDEVLSEMVRTIFTQSGIREYATGDICSNKVVSKRLMTEYQVSHPDWFHLESDDTAVFKYRDDGVIVKLVVSCLDVCKIYMEQIR